MLQHTIRASRVVVGLALVLAGLVLALPGVPGPGLLVVFVGLTVLSAEFEWARRLRDRLHGMLRRGTGRADVQ
ncbi:MAG TPA: PGPGW domain-containing protein [Verrucomicrobiae bacterium]|nr:PGPGW domain-containing protein [Verrucomicrobiae bacterium]